MFVANIQTLLQIFELYGYNYQSLSVSLSIHLRKYSNWMAITIKLNKNCDKHKILNFSNCIELHKFWHYSTDLGMNSYGRDQIVSRMFFIDI